MRATCRLPPGSAARGPTCARACAAAVWCALVTATASGAADPLPPAPTGIALADVLDATLRSSPEIHLAAQQAALARGILTEAGAPFDTTIGVAAAWSRTHPALEDGTTLTRTETSVDAGVDRRFRNGLLVQPQAGVRRTDLSTQPGLQTSNLGTAGLTVVVPLLRDRGGAATAAAEVAARFGLRSSRMGLLHTVSERVLTAVLSYWDYLAAHQRLATLRASEERAERISEQTRVLVRADERTNADLTQTLGNLAAKKVTRLAAEQAFVESRQRLGLAMGVPAAAIAALPPPATGFPSLPADAPLPAAEGASAATAHERRADLLAAQEDLRAAEALVKGARSELQPQLDLAVTTGYDTTIRGQGFSDVFAPLYRRPRLDASFRLVYALPLRNARAEGLFAQASAAAEQRRIVRDDLGRRIDAAVAVSREALWRGAAGMRESEEAVRLLSSTVHAQQRQFEVGASTLFDVIAAQDALTNALLGQIESQRSYAAAIAALRFESGILVAGDPDRPAIDAAGLQAPP
jgi:outer membrane protein